MGRFHRILPLLGGLAVLQASLPAPGVPRLDLSTYPPVAPGLVRWVIQLPGVLPPAADPALSPDPADWRVELLVGRELALDCNRRQLQGQITAQPLPALGTSLFRVSGGEAVISTRMACPGEQDRRRGFVTLAAPPTVLPYNASLPIVVDAPRGVEVRWRLWKAERQQQRARPQP